MNYSKLNNRLSNQHRKSKKEETSERSEILITTYSYDKAGNRIKEVTIYESHFIEISVFFIKQIRSI